MASLASKRKRDTNDIPQPRLAPGMGVGDFEHQYGLGGDEDSNDMAFGLGTHNHDQSDVHHHSDSKFQQGPSASDTAAAAMAQYHTMTVPQPTEQAFMHQPIEPNDRPNSASLDQSYMGGQQRTSSFGDHDASGVKDAANGAGSPTQGGANKTQSTPKPQVGTEEWHKVRRDNHKEGKSQRR